MKGLFGIDFANPISAIKSYSHPFETMRTNINPVKKIRAEYDPFYDPFENNEDDEDE